MINKKPCPVCTYLKIYPEEHIFEINDLIFLGGKQKEVLDLLSKFKILNNMQKPSNHYIEKHKTDCLSDYIVKYNGINDISNKKDSLLNTSLQDSLDDYKKMSVQERDNVHIERLKEIKYLSGVIIHQVLLNGKYSRTIPKEDISALKQIEDIINTVNYNEEDNKPKENIFEKLTDEQGRQLHSWLTEND